MSGRRVVPNTTGETLEAQVHPFTHAPLDGLHRRIERVPSHHPRAHHREPERA
ncbi:MAG: hypothetical protein J2P37_30545 [Ktedonobacteraceae bacterium]|nr:hypothetical protein [Ktedonobacteraceae bacterium]MBO0792197.1 hypothetical protein [Ktedonobacteraceae bacterium]